MTFESFEAGSECYTVLWKDFLEKLTGHLEERGWFEGSYVEIAEKREAASLKEGKQLH